MNYLLKRMMMALTLCSVTAHADFTLHALPARAHTDIQESVARNLLRRHLLSGNSMPKKKIMRLIPAMQKKCAEKKLHEKRVAQEIALLLSEEMDFYAKLQKESWTHYLSEIKGIIGGGIALGVLAALSICEKYNAADIAKRIRLSLDEKGVILTNDYRGRLGEMFFYPKNQNKEMLQFEVGNLIRFTNLAEKRLSGVPTIVASTIGSLGLTGLGITGIGNRYNADFYYKHYGDLKHELQQHLETLV